MVMNDCHVPALEADLSFVLTNLPGTIMSQVSVPRDRLKLCVVFKCSVLPKANSLYSFGVLCFPLVVASLVRTPSFLPLCVMLCGVCHAVLCVCHAVL